MLPFKVKVTLLGRFSSGRRSQLSIEQYSKSASSNALKNFVVSFLALRKRSPYISSGVAWELRRGGETGQDVDWQAAPFSLDALTHQSILLWGEMPGQLWILAWEEKIVAGQDVDRQTGLLHPSLLNSVNTVSNSKAFSSPLKQDSTLFQGVTANTHGNI